MRSRLRVTVRMRLTFIYGGLFLLAGATLLAVNYALVRHNLPPRIEIEAPTDGSRDRLLVDGGPGPGATPISPAELQQLDRATDRFRDETLDQLVVQSTAALGVTAVIAVALGWLVAGRVLRPVHEITEAARRLSERNLHERINLRGPRDELRELADTFDEMLARLDAAFESQSRFVANASHELRTPLAIMRTELEVAQRDPAISRDRLLATVSELQTVIERTERVVEGLLTLARSSRASVAHEAVDMADVAETALAEAEHELRDRSLAALPDLRPAVTMGDGNLLEHLAANLIGNAARYNIPHGWVSVATRAENGTAVLEVANTGPVIEGEVETLLEPFRRQAHDRVGSDRGAGLGLSIVRAVAEAHGGRVSLSARAEGGGLTVRVELPAPS